MFPTLMGASVYIDNNHYETHFCRSLLYLSFLVTVFWDVREDFLEKPAALNLQS
jgi:hypothetical protein